MSELRIPDLGEGIEEGTVTAVLVAVGDVLEPGQSVIEIETDKVTLEVPAPRGGTIAAIEVSAAQVVRPGDLVLRLAAAPAEPPGDPVVAGEREAARQGRPGATDPGASCGGPRVGTQRVAAADAASGARPAPDAVARPGRGDGHGDGERPPAAPAPYRPLPAGPAARREARELGVDLAMVPASGPRGRITREDVRRHVRALCADNPSSAASSDAPAAPPLPDLAAHGPVRREPLSRIERTTAANLTRAARSVPMAWVAREVDVSALEQARRRLRAQQTPDAPPLTLTSVLCKALAVAVQEQPRFNAAFDAAGEAVVYRGYVNIGVAVDTPRGLLVPVLRDADRLDIRAIAAVLSGLSSAARDGTLGAAELRGAGITVSNLGALGVDAMQPLVNWPEAAILGVSAMRRVTTEAGTARLVLPLTLGFDHRLINGADAARLLARLAALLGEPLALAIAA